MMIYKTFVFFLREKREIRNISNLSNDFVFLFLFLPKSEIKNSKTKNANIIKRDLKLFEYV